MTLAKNCHGYCWNFACNPRGNRYILVVGDYFTKWKKAFPLADMEARSISQMVVNEIICQFSIPDTILTDQGRNFESGLIRDIC